MSLTKKVALNTFIQIIGKVVVTAVSLVTIGALTRFLGVSGYGEYTTIFAYVSFWAVLADFGFFWVLVREISKPNSDEEKIFNNVLTFKLLFGLAVFVLSAAVGFLIPQYSWTLKIGIAIISAGWFWMSLNQTYVGLFQSKLEMYKSVISEVVSRTVILGGVLLTIKLGYGLQEILLVYIIGNFLNFLISFIFGSAHIKFKPKFDLSLWKMILKESFPLALLTFIGLIHFRIDTVILSLYKGSLDVGIYGVPFKILEVIILIPSIFIGNVFPILTRYYHGQDQRFSSSIQKTFEFLAILAFPVVAGLFLLAQPIISLIAGQEYLTASTVSIFNINFTASRVLEILAFSIGLTFIISVFSNLLTVIEKQQKQVLPMIIVTVGNIIANMLIIPKYSYVGSAAINVLTELVMLIWWSSLVNKYLHIRLDLRMIPKIILATLIMSVFLYLVRYSTNVIIVSILGVLVYILIAYLLKIIDKSMIRKLLPGNLEKRTS